MRNEVSIKLLCYYLNEMIIYIELILCDMMKKKGAMYYERYE